VSADRVIRALERLGYVLLRQKGSHVRLRYSGSPVHNVTVPMHNPLKSGTLHGILAEVAEMRSVPIESIFELL
jgi:predicted RNA binding protein YcfA (HicA-like mRNA interferase family)